MALINVLQFCTEEQRDVFVKWFERDRKGLSAWKGLMVHRAEEDIALLEGRQLKRNQEDMAPVNTKRARVRNEIEDPDDGNNIVNIEDANADVENCRIADRDAASQKPKLEEPPSDKTGKVSMICNASHVQDFRG